MNVSDVGRILIAYGLLEGQLKHISEVPRGLACNCICPKCAGALVARQGDVRIAHFAHTVQTTCDGGTESVLHRLAKELISGMDSMSIPAYEFLGREVVGSRTVEYCSLVTSEEKVAFSRVQVEHRLSGMVPDLLLWCGDRTLIVEIAVTHRVDEFKRAQIAEVGLPAIEIRLAPTDVVLSREELRAKLANDLASKQWLFHPKQLEHEEKFLSLVTDARNRLNQERRESDRIYIRQITRQSPRALPPADSFSMKQFLQFERHLAQFFLKNRRFPSLSESRQLYGKQRSDD
jgi:hypothetical protein